MYVMFLSWFLWHRIAANKQAKLLNQVLLVTKLITSFRKFYVHLHGLVTFYKNICVTDDYVYGYVPFVVITIPSFPHS
jgi:hypothetical protein